MREVLPVVMKLNFGVAVVVGSGIIVLEAAPTPTLPKTQTPSVNV
jgi:hypothetical protein